MSQGRLRVLLLDSLPLPLSLSLAGAAAGAAAGRQPPRGPRPGGPRPPPRGLCVCVCAREHACVRACVSVRARVRACAFACLCARARAWRWGGRARAQQVTRTFRAGAGDVPADEGREHRCDVPAAVVTRDVTTGRDTRLASASAPAAPPTDRRRARGPGSVAGGAVRPGRPHLLMYGLTDVRTREAVQVRAVCLLAEPSGPGVPTC